MMDFLSESFSVKLVSVLTMEMEPRDTYVPPRPYSTLSFRLKGSATISDAAQTFQVGDHDIVYIPAGVGHHLTSDAEKLIVVHFNITGKEQQNLEVYSSSNPDSLRELFVLLAEVWGTRRGYYLRSMTLFHRVLESLYFQGSRGGDPNYDRIKETVQYIHREFRSSTLSVQTLCQMSGMSDTYYRKLFWDLFQTTPNRYINNLRISYAEELLSTSVYSVEQVAERCGFSDVKYFSAVFKKKLGCPPSVYKSQHMQPPCLWDFL